MALSNARIQKAGVSPHPHEQAGVEWVRRNLPDTDPYQMWALFDLLDPSGRRYEMDLLVLGWDALYHIELKGHPGRVTGNSVDWTFTFPDGRTARRENPYRLADQKSRVLASMLERRLGKDRPFVETLVFLSDADIKVDLDSGGKTRVVTRSTLLPAVTHGDIPGVVRRPRPRIDKPRMKAIIDAVAALGIRESKGAQRVGEYALGGIIEEGPGYQDRAAVNERLSTLRRRVRSYLVPQSPGAEQRAQLVRAADREGRLLTALRDHPGILRLTDVTTDPAGAPCLLFEHDDSTLSLDAYLRQNPSLTLWQRLAIVEQVADALEYCHRKKVLHRGLSPHAVLIETDAANAPIAKLYNFQLASQGDLTSGTQHLSALGVDTTLLYRAPEVLEDPRRATEASDMFSLGALTYYLLTGRHPGESLAERHRLLTAGGGRLMISAVADSFAAGARPSELVGEEQRRSLDELIGMVTEVNPLERSTGAVEWAQLLLYELTEPAPPPAVPPMAAPVEADPLLARRDDKIGAYAVVKVLGTGATAKVFQVTNGSEATFALKVSRSAESDVRLVEEAEALKGLRHDRIVGFIGGFVSGGRQCLVLEDAGETLADYLAKNGPPGLDFARRWGEDLMLALRELAGRGVLHRDIKPANLGVSEGRAKRARSLFLFDFSLAGVDAKETMVGTSAYRDPFLVTRDRCDEAGDRWSAATSLYELLTCTLPVWGDGTQAAIASAASMTVVAERFDPSVRERLLSFFQTAFAREVADRHPDAETMRDAWLACFTATAAQVSAEAERAEVDVSRLRPDTAIAAIDGLSNRAKNALDRSGVVFVRDLQSLPSNHLSAMRGIGRDTGKEVLSLIRAATTLERSVDVAPFITHFAGPDVPVAAIASLPRPVVASLENAGLLRSTEVAATSRERLTRVLKLHRGAVEALAQQLATDAPSPPKRGKRRKGASDAEALPAALESYVERLFPADGVGDRNVRKLFALDPASDGNFYDTVRPLAALDHVVASAYYVAKSRAVDRWRQDASLAALAAMVEAALDAGPGVAPVDQVAADLVDALPHDRTLPEVALRSARALVRAVAESRPEMEFVRIASGMWVARNAEVMTVVEHLGRTADELSRIEPLPAFEVVREALLKVLDKTPLEGTPPEQLVRLAARASAQAYVSARLELYPRGMSAERALTLSAGALAAARGSLAQVRRLVKLRYPEAAPLPEDDAALGDVLRRLGLTVQGDAFERPGALDSSTNHTEQPLPRQQTVLAPNRPTTDPREQDRRDFVEKLKTSARKRSFRVLEVSSKYARSALLELERVLKVSPVSVEREVLRALDVLCAEQEISLDLVMQTDRSGSTSEQWQRLVALMHEAATTAVARILASGSTLLLYDAGILARYGLDHPLHMLLAATEADDGPGVFLVVPITGDPDVAPVLSAPRNQGLTIPTSNTSQRLVVPLAWLTND